MKKKTKPKIIWNLVEPKLEPCKEFGGVLISVNKAYIAPIIKNLEDWK